MMFVVGLALRVCSVEEAPDALFELAQQRGVCRAGAHAQVFTNMNAASWLDVGTEPALRAERPGHMALFLEPGESPEVLP